MLLCPLPSHPMTLIDSESFHSVVFLLGTLLFTGIILWAIWFASNMD